MIKIYDETYRLESEQLIKKIETFKPCTKEEVIEYYKDKNAIILQVSDNNDYTSYILTNDGKTAINLKSDVVPIDELNISKIAIWDNRCCFIDVWTNKVEMNVKVNYDSYVDLGDGYILQYNCLMKKSFYDHKCTKVETINFYLNKAAIRIETEDNKVYYLSNYWSKVISSDNKISDLELFKLDVKRISIHDDFYGWITVWKKDEEGIVFEFDNGKLHITY